VSLHWEQLPVLPAPTNRDLVCTAQERSKVQNDVERSELISEIRIAMRRSTP